MSDFNSLKSMWENKAKEGSQVPQQVKALPEKLRAPTNLELSQRGSQSNSLNVPIIETEMPRQSVASLKTNLEGKIKFGVNNQNMYQSSMTVSKSQISDEISSENSSPKLHVREVEKSEIQQRVPTFMESKAGLERMFEKKKSGPITEVENTYINLRKNEEEGESLTPEERTEQIIRRIFSETYVSSIRTTEPSHLEYKEEMKINGQGYLDKNEEAKNLTLRGQKKEKRTLQDFDDA